MLISILWFFSSARIDVLLRCLLRNVKHCYKKRQFLKIEILIIYTIRENKEDIMTDYGMMRDFFAP